MTLNHVKVLILCTLAACIYGVLHDQVTVRLCIEYFTIAHPPLFSTTSPTLLAICWGVTASAGMGAALGLVLAMVSQSGTTSPVPIFLLSKSIAILLGVMALAAFTAGCVGYQLAVRGLVLVPGELFWDIPVTQHHWFIAVWAAHITSYAVGLGGGVRLCYRIWKQRGSPFVIAALPRTRAAILRVAGLVAVIVAALYLKGCLPT